MGKYSFINWLQLREDTPSQQAIEIRVARWLEDILDKAAALKKQEMAAGISKSFSDYARRVWPQDAIQGYDLVLPSIFPPDIAGQPVQFKLKPDYNRADTIHDNGRFEGFVINIFPFNRAKTPEEVDAYLEDLKSTMHHEAEHIYNVGGEYDPESYENDDERHRASMEYMANPGELRAHARQMAYIYAKHFPGEPFDLAKAQSILSKPGFTQTHKNYFGQLAKPEVWQKQVAKFGYKHTNPHDEIMPLVQQFLTQYQG